ncbi:MAG: peptidylprolyl isomerase [Desulfuromonadales bacterium]
MQKSYLSACCLRACGVAVMLAMGTVALAAEPDAKKGGELVAVATPKPVTSGPVARVNGVVIDAVELRRAVKVLLRGQAVPADQQSAVDKQALEQLVAAEILYQAAAKSEVKDLEKLVDEKVAQGKSRFKDEKDFAKAIKDLEMDEKDLRAYTRRDIIISKFVESVMVPKVKVLPADIRAFYDQNPERFSRPESVRASHILIAAAATASADEKKKAREKAEKLLKELKGGADFAALAKANSADGSSQQGGDLGSFGKGQMVAPFEEAVFALKPGEVSNVVETQFGYHIIKLVEKSAAEKVEFKDVSAKIEEFLKAQKLNETVGEFLTNAKKTAKIEILLK